MHDQAPRTLQPRMRALHEPALGQHGERCGLVPQRRLRVIPSNAARGAAHDFQGQAVLPPRKLAEGGWLRFQVLTLLQWEWSPEQITGTTLAA